jgi:excisionase family DNA binding protein
MAHAHIPVVPLTNRRAYSLAEVAAVTGFSLSFIYELIKSGTLRSRKIGGRRIVTVEALAELLGEVPSDEVPAPATTHERPGADTAVANHGPPAALAVASPPSKSRDTVTVPDRRSARRNIRTEGEVRGPPLKSAAAAHPSSGPERGGAR